MKLHAPQGPNQLWSHFVQLARVIAGELLKDVAALARQAEDGATLVILVNGSFDEVFVFGAIDQFDGTVVSETETARSVGDRNECAFGCTGNLEQKLMLLRLQPGIDRCVFAELEEFAELESKFCQWGEQVIRMGEIRLHIHNIVSRYISPRE
jgi:hypothetical protein